jgi:5-(carboxyamino)imidazole ribonucleotide synthase
VTTRVGIVGGGQLGRMLAQAAHPLGISCTTMDPSATSPAAQVAPAIVSAFDERSALLSLADASDVVTYEFENVPADAARYVEGFVPVLPPPAALEAAQDRLAEKTLFGEVGLPVPPFAQVDDVASLRAGVEAIGTPAVLKTRRLGYDGKGQAVIRHAELAEDAWRAVGEAPSILESFVAFDREVAIVGARARGGATAFYPVVENEHRDGILRVTRAPATHLSRTLQVTAETYAGAVMERLEYVGVLAIELFEANGDLQGNEMAPRVHNSAHWTIEGAETSQFEQHLRAICDLPLGGTGMLGVATMVNLIGRVPDISAVLAIPGAHLHLYGKEPRPGRKVGHVTVRADDDTTLANRVGHLLQAIGRSADA